MAENYVLLETIALTQSAASVTFDNLPTSGYTDLKVVASTRSDVNSVDALVMSINGSTANFTYRFMDGGAGTPRSGTAKVDGIVNGTDYTASTFSSNEIYISNYRSSNFKSFGIEYVTENNASAGYNGFTAGLWSQTAAITSLSFARASTGNLVAGSTFSLYGIAALGTTPVTAPFASGGNIVANDGTYWYHAFLSSGTFTPTKALTCDVLVVAGGGGGGYFSGGGGGAGGFLTFTSQALTEAQNYNITIGSGGVGAPSAGPHQGGQGNDSQFGALTLVKGGGAGGGPQGASPSSDGQVGGSGGGGAGTSSGDGGNGASGTSGQGNAGGNGAQGAEGYSGGGGGGAGGAGTSGSGNYTPGNGGIGGVGSSTAISGGSATGVGQNVSGTYFFAGGGGGAGRGYGGTLGVGGNGGGGTGGQESPNNAATNAMQNTGGGGGGGYGAGQAKAGNGASGIVIVRYSMSS